MTYGNAPLPLRPLSIRSLAIWATAALLLGCTFALAGLAGIYVAIAFAVVFVFAAVVARYPAPVMGAAIWFLALFPYTWGIQTGVVPKLFGDESLLLLYLAVFPFLYLFTERLWRHGFDTLYIVLVVFVFTQALPFTVAKDLVAWRNFCETYVLGALLCVLFLQESSNSDAEPVATSIVWVTLIIALMTIVERIVQRNPIMEHQVDILYLSPEIARITEGVYRPYTTFFHPSEAGTFMALGVPFAVRKWVQRKSWFSLLVLLIVAAGFFVNNTRGVWMGLAVATLLVVSRAWLVLFAITPVALAVGSLSYLIFKNTPFMQRVTDPNDLFSRFEYWILAVKMIVAHPFIGVGHMQFKTLYLDYVQDTSNLAHLDMAKVAVADNMYLTTAVEHGLLGILTLLGLLFLGAVILKRYRNALLAKGLIRQASFVRCSQMALAIYAATGFFADLNQFTRATKYVFILVGMGVGVGARYVTLTSNAASIATDAQPVMRLSAD